jgi:ribosomal-protein-alanine N-acetyltransferase
MTLFHKLDSSHLESISNILKGFDKASPKDLHRFGLSWSDAQIENSLTKDICLGLFEDTRLVSVLIGRTIGPTFEIDMTITNIKDLKKGFMKKLFQEAIGYLQTQKQVRQIWLEVNEENHAAVNFYKKMGFATNSIRPKYYPDGKGAILMTLHL